MNEQERIDVLKCMAARADKYSRPMTCVKRIVNAHQTTHLISEHSAQRLLRCARGCAMRTLQMHQLVARVTCIANHSWSPAQDLSTIRPAIPEI